MTADNIYLADGIEDHQDQNQTNIEPRQRPVNVYYNPPYNDLLFLIYTLSTSFILSWISDYVSITESVILWIGFVVSCLACIMTNPELCVERVYHNDTDPGSNKNQIVRRPLIGFKYRESVLDLDGIRNGLYDAEDDYYTDPRLRDGYRYGRALIRI